MQQESEENKKDEVEGIYTGGSGKRTGKGKFSELIDDIDIKSDPYFLKYYRSYHNHELDTNLIEN